MTIQLVERWHAKAGGEWTRYGRTDTGGTTDPGPVTPPPVNDRDSLVYGEYEPSAATTGLLPGYSLTDLDEYNDVTANTVVIPAGAEISNKIIYGDVTFAGNSEFHNCWFHGGRQTFTNGNVGVLTCNTTVRNGIARVYDSVIKPRQESDGRDCVIGRQFELYRVAMSGGVDGVGIYSSSTSNPDCQVKVVGCLIDDLSYRYPDQDHPADGTHNDNIQFQGGRGVHVMGNSLRGYSHAMAGSQANPVYPWFLTGGRKYSNGAVILVQKNTGLAPDETVIFEDNYIRGGGAQQVNLKATAPSFVYRNNKHYRDVAVKPAGATGGNLSGYWIRGDASMATNASIVGLTSGDKNNRWIDGPYAGQVLVAPRDRGISWG